MTPTTTTTTPPLNRCEKFGAPPATPMATWLATELCLGHRRVYGLQWAIGCLRQLLHGVCYTIGGLWVGAWVGWEVRAPIGVHLDHRSSSGMSQGLCWTVGSFMEVCWTIGNLECVCVCVSCSRGCCSWCSFCIIVVLFSLLLVFCSSFPFFLFPSS